MTSNAQAFVVSTFDLCNPSSFYTLRIETLETLEMKFDNIYCVSFSTISELARINLQIR